MEDNDDDDITELTLENKGGAEIRSLSNRSNQKRKRKSKSKPKEGQLVRTVADAPENDVANAIVEYSVVVPPPPPLPIPLSCVPPPPPPYVPLSNNNNNNDNGDCGIPSDEDDHDDNDNDNENESIDLDSSLPNRTCCRRKCVQHSHQYYPHMHAHHPSHVHSHQICHRRNKQYQKCRTSSIIVSSEGRGSKGKSSNNSSNNNNNDSDTTTTTTTNNNKNKRHKSVRHELLYFCQNTTIRGIGRIVRTREKSTRTLWIGFFAILCVGLLTSQTILIRQFLEYNVIHPPRVLRNRPSPFPSITLCNHRPLNHDIRRLLLQRRMRNPREFATVVNNMAKEHLFDRGHVTEYATLTSSLSLSGYLESVPLELHSDLGHNLSDLVIKCLVTYRNGSKHMIKSCHEAGIWSIVPHAQYINCFSYTVASELSLETTTLELYLYLNEEANSSNCFDCFISNVKSQLSGALLVIHNNGSLPNINQEAINLQPGTLTDVRLKTFLNEMMTPPYGRCHPGTEDSLVMADKLYTYTEHACKIQTIQQEINKKCKCSTVEYSLVDRSLPFCSAMPQFIHQQKCNSQQQNESELAACLKEISATVSRLKCKSSVTVLYHNDIIDTCNLPCSYYSYESDRSISSWPTKSYQLTWMGSNVASQIIYKQELNEYLKARDHFRNGKSELAMKIINSLNILEKRLVALVINKPNKNLHKVEEKAVLSLTSFLSQLGGLFSIWIGLTLISIVEIIELVFKLIEVYHSRVSTTAATTTTTTRRSTNSVNRNKYSDELVYDDEKAKKTNVLTNDFQNDAAEDNSNRSRAVSAAGNKKDVDSNV